MKVIEENPSEIAIAHELAELNDRENNTSCVDYCPHIILRHKRVYLNLSQNLQINLLTDNLTHLDLTNNKLTEVPKAVLDLKQIVKINLSNNSIKYFDEIPEFIHKVQDISLANNLLRAPPLWIWKNTPRKLKCLNLSENTTLVDYLTDYEKNEYLKYNLNIFRVLLFNCCLHTFLDLLDTLTDVTEIAIGGADDCNKLRANQLYQFPLDNIMECYNARGIQVRNCKIYDITDKIINYSRIKYLDLSVNYIVMLPENIGDLTNLEILVLSSNKLGALPNSMLKLTELKTLLLTSNRLEYIPDNLCSLPNLQEVDFYDNLLPTIPEGYERLNCVDLARNYFSVPQTDEYAEQRAKLRCHYPTYYEKVDESKPEPPPSEYDSDDDFDPAAHGLDDYREVEPAVYCWAPPENWDVDDDDDNEAAALPNGNELQHELF